MSWSVALAVVLMIAPQSATTGDHADSAIEQAQLRQFAPEVAQSWSFADEHRRRLEVLEARIRDVKRGC